MSENPLKGIPRPASGAAQEKVIGHAVIKPFDLPWVGIVPTVGGTILVGGLLPVLHIAGDGALLVRVHGVRCYVKKEEVLEFRSLNKREANDGRR